MQEMFPVPVLASCAAPAVLPWCPENREARSSAPPVPRSSLAFVSLLCCEQSSQPLDLPGSVCRKNDKNNGQVKE